MCQLLRLWTPGGERERDSSTIDCREYIHTTYNLWFNCLKYRTLHTPSVSASEPVLSRWTARLEPSVMMSRLTANITSRAGSRIQYLDIHTYIAIHTYTSILMCLARPILCTVWSAVWPHQR